MHLLDHSKRWGGVCLLQLRDQSHGQGHKQQWEPRGISPGQLVPRSILLHPANDTHLPLGTGGSEIGTEVKDRGRVPLGGPRGLCGAQVVAILQEKAAGAARSPWKAEGSHLSCARQAQPPGLCGEGRGATGPCVFSYQRENQPR